MELLATLNYPYQFIIRLPTISHSSPPTRLHPTNEIQYWCKENCKGQWYITTTETYLTFYAPVDHVSPISDKPFKPSTVSSEKCILLAFAEENEAVAFKLTFEKAVDIKK